MQKEKTFQAEGTAGAKTERLKEHRGNNLARLGVWEGGGRAGQMLKGLVHNVTASELHLVNNRGSLRYCRQGWAMG